MKRWSAAVVVVCAVWCPAPAYAQNDLAGVPRVSVAQARAMTDAGRAVVLDVRDPASFASGHLPGAVLFVPGDVKAFVASARAAKKTVITYCA